jgi:cell division protein FtsB
MQRYWRILKNKYFISTAILVMMLLFFEDTNVFRLVKYKIEYYKVANANMAQEAEIEKIAKKTAELTTNVKTLEFFARETYRMKKTNETIFLFVEKEE